jgi:signal transduction histidine kinase
MLKAKLLSPRQIPKAAALLAQNALGKATGPEEFTLRRKDGTRVEVEILNYPVKIRDESLSLGMARDITERKQVEEELKQSREQLRNLAAHLQSAREGERTSLAREIHDELGQALTALMMDTYWLNKNLLKGQSSLLSKTQSMTKFIEETAKKVKNICTELRPGLLDDLGLIAALEWQTDEFQSRTGIKCDLSIKQEKIQLDDERSTAIFRVYQETLTNVARHAHASRITIGLRVKDDWLELEVRDDGKGITDKQISKPDSFGIIGIKERVDFMHGEFEIAGKSGKGTTVTVRIPY